MRINRRLTASLGLVAGIALSQTLAASASAVDYPAEVHFTSSTSQTLEYGQYWTFNVESNADFYWGVYVPDAATVSVTGAPSGFTPQLSMYQSSTFNGTLSPQYEVAPLGVGTYNISIGGSFDDGTDTYTVGTPATAMLTVEKAKLGMELRVVPDPSTTDALIFTARFTGRFVDEYQSSFFPGAAKSPEGTWNIVVTDENGETATERTVERSAGDDNLATSFYWADAEPGVEYSASATFTVSGSSASNFSITNAQDFSFTGVESARPVPTSSATFEPDTDLPEATGFSLPLWVIVVVALLIVALGVLVTILSVRLSKRSRATTGERAA